MKFTRKIPNTDKELSTYFHMNNWKKLKEPSNIAWAIIFSFPIAYLLGAFSLWFIHHINPTLFTPLIHILKKSNNLSFSINFNIRLLFKILYILAFMIIHELIHAIFIPNILESKKTFIGINGVFAFVYTSEPIKKARFIIISIMPFIVLSIVFPFMVNILGLMNNFIIFLVLLNAMGSCVDFLNIFLIMFQVPNSSTIINNGNETYFKN